MVGVMMACYGDMGTFGLMGVIVTVFCVVMSGMKNVLSGEMLTGDIKVRQQTKGRKEGRNASVEQSGHSWNYNKPFCRDFLCFWCLNYK